MLFAGKRAASARWWPAGFILYVRTCLVNEIADCKGDLGPASMAAGKCWAWTSAGDRLRNQWKVIGRWLRVSSMSQSDIEICDIQGIILNELSPRLHHVAHQLDE